MSADDGVFSHSILCAKCQSVFVDFTEWMRDRHQGQVHHPDLASLRQAAILGCYVCTRVIYELEAEYGTDRLLCVRYCGILSGRRLERESWSGAIKDFSLAFQIELRNKPANPEDDEESFGCSFDGIQLRDAIELSAMRTTVQTTTRSSNSMLQARTWIEQCGSSHSMCTIKAKGHWIPSRLVCVEGNISQGLSARVCSKAGLSPWEPYLTLSHRWGSMSASSSMLNTGNHDEWKTSVPIQCLNQVFQDAIYVTASLGFKFIWIDSLCIIQDDPDDWTRESMQMHHVYQHAACNLAASDYENSDQGLLLAERKFNPVPAVVQPTWTKVLAERLSDFREEDVELDQRFVLTECDPFMRVSCGPLFSRAWVLQEQILVRRPFPDVGASTY